MEPGAINVPVAPDHDYDHDYVANDADGACDDADDSTDGEPHRARACPICVGVHA